MKIGTKSVLYGAHAFWLHPFFVAVAWWKLYGFPWDLRLWVAFAVHDLGYWGKPNMDGDEGERHPERAALWMSRWFDRLGLEVDEHSSVSFIGPTKSGATVSYTDRSGRRRRHTLGKWGEFVLFHSRFYAKKYGGQVSKLCVADKLALALTPAWLYLPMVRLTGEIQEYRQKAAERRDLGETTEGSRLMATDLEWYRGVQQYMRDWVEAHKDGQPDTWTPDTRQARDDTGVWS